MPKKSPDSLKENYILRSTFFYDKLRAKGYFDLFLQIKSLCGIEGKNLNWAQREQWKISDAAWNVLEDTDISPMLIFLHPKILQMNPGCLRYYRSVAMLPQKGLKAISGVSNVERIEEGESDPGSLSSETITKLVCSINEVLSLVVSLSTEINANEIQGMMYAAAGANIDGSWRNSIGSEGERVIRSIILNELLAQGEVSSVTNRQNKTVSIDDLDSACLLKNIDNIRIINLINGYSLLFATEPDVSMYDDSGTVVGIIEIKAGLDPAGALERLGAMLKSFENTLAEYPKAVTILVASCITDEMESRISASMLIHQKYISTDITSNDSKQRKFANSVRSLLNLIKQ